MKKSACIYLYGIVQGVGMRYSVYRKATSLGLLGYVKNTIEGSVKIEVEGDETLILMLLAYVEKDVRWAKVERTKIIWKEYEGKYKLFEIYG
jgi:acylphosphatase